MDDAVILDNDTTDTPEQPTENLDEVLESLTAKLRTMAAVKEIHSTSISEDGDGVECSITYTLDSDCSPWQMHEYNSVVGQHGFKEEVLQHNSPIRVVAYRDTYEKQYDPQSGTAWGGRYSETA